MATREVRGVGRWLVLLLGLVVALVVGSQFGWRWVFAPLFAWAFVTWAVGSLRAMTQDGRAIANREAPQPVVVERAERVWYWCEDCGTELLEVVRGTGKPPRHCAQAMNERAEVPRATLDP